MKSKKSKSRTKAVPELQAAKTDPQGSYTGVPANPEEKPVQDADDL